MYYLLDSKMVNIFNIIKRNSIFHRERQVLWNTVALCSSFSFRLISRWRWEISKCKEKDEALMKKEKRGRNLLRDRQENDKKYVRLKAL